MTSSTSLECQVPEAKTRLGHKLHAVLNGSDRGSAAIAILAATKPDVPGDWKR